MSSLLRSSPALTNALCITNLAALGAATAYFKGRHDDSLEAHEARMDELEGTLRGHIGLIEDALERIEGGGQGGGKGQGASDGKGQGQEKSDRAERLYTQRARDEKK
ncbi:hypothetical protein GGR56DRAFT_676500 [Xylariaceae sp. FL0804]|nr:hypothetical protein GGR56DRAFT_676500 [Xylariaceae sp. FL0804]